MARPRIAIVGAGFAGYHAARTLSRLSRGRAEIALVNPMDYFLYLPLLPEVAAGVIDPRRVAVSLPETLPEVRLILGEADPDRPQHPPGGLGRSRGWPRRLWLRPARPGHG
jgi:NADH:ubiquinone reductase (H+-translocating)